MNNAWKLLLNNTWIYYDNRSVPVAQVVRQGNHHDRWQLRILDKPGPFFTSAEQGKQLAKQLLGI